MKCEALQCATCEFCECLVAGAVACVTLLDRLKEDQIDVSEETLKEWDQRPAKLVARLIKNRLHIQE